MKDSNIKLLIMDVDGTLTDGKVYMSEHGELFKAFDIKDGLGIHNILPASGITPVIITGRRSNILKLRCDEIGIKYLYQGVSDKTGTLDSLLSELALDYSNCAYIGDDIMIFHACARLHSLAALLMQYVMLSVYPILFLQRMAAVVPSGIL